MTTRDSSDGADDAATPGTVESRGAASLPRTGSFHRFAGELFEAVQTEELFDDSKAFVDYVPADDPVTVRDRYHERREEESFDLETFVEANFDAPEPVEARPRTKTAATMEQHVSRLWERLAKPQQTINEYDSLVELPNPHVVPGGRFREGYYWDSYFVAEGLAAEGRLDLVEDMAENLASMIDRFGFVPNGNRQYLLTRSQAPVFCELVAIVARERGIDAIRPFLPRLEREYEFWMAGQEEVAAADALPGGGPARHRVVALGDGVLNRYWDAEPAPRPESYREDVALAERVPVAERETLYRDLRAACESGWDFSGRWLADQDTFHSIRTTDLVPVDLNAFLFAIERRLGEWYGAVGDDERAERYREAARARRVAIDRYCWDEEAGFYVDYDWVEGAPSDVWSLAAVAPLYVGAASQRQADAVATALEERFLRAGGLLTTLSETGQQWDAPNGWAPLHWMAVHGLARYGHDGLAEEIRRRWLARNRAVFDEHGTLLEKYDVTAAGTFGGGGEYPLQEGFGWTNGVAVALGSELDPIASPGPTVTDRLDRPSADE